MTNVIVPERSEPKAPAMMPAPPTPPTPTGVLLRDNGVLMLTEEFSQEKIMPLVAQLLEWNMMPEEKAPDHVKLYINSPGGSVHYPKGPTRRHRLLSTLLTRSRCLEFQYILSLWALLLAVGALLSWQALRAIGM